MKQVEILGVRIDNLSKKEIFLELERILGESEMGQIVTINPEIFLKAKEDEVLLKIINNSRLVLADGIGLKFAFWRFGKHLRKRMTGIDLTWKILELANQKNLKVLLVANRSGLTTWEEAREAIQKKYPELYISGVNIDPLAGHYDKSIELSNFHVKEGHIPFDILLCNFGAPYQEKFIASLNRWNNTVHLAAGIGGSFEFITKKISRAPKVFRILGLEWIWRLIKQPKRIRRILRAIIVFPIRILFSK